MKVLPITKILSDLDYLIRKQQRARKTSKLLLKQARRDILERDAERNKEHYDGYEGEDQ